VPRAERAVELARTGHSVDRSTHCRCASSARTLAEIEMLVGRPT
jgi:hypothetical protein